MTPQQLEILQDYKRSRSPFKTAKTFGLDVKDVWQLIEQNQEFLRNKPERFGGHGRPELRKYTVCRRLLKGARWDNEHPDIAFARQLYEEGRVELCTARDGGWEILYAIPRAHRKPRPGYFQLEQL